MPTVSGIIFEDASASVSGLLPGPVPNTGQTAWLATNGAYAGALVRVEILRLALEDVDGDGTADVLHLVVNGAVIDASNAVQLAANGQPKQVEEKRPGLLLSSVSEGTETIEGFVQKQLELCLERMVTKMTQMAVYESIPSAV